MRKSRGKTSYLAVSWSVQDVSRAVPLACGHPLTPPSPFYGGLMIPMMMMIIDRNKGTLTLGGVSNILNKYNNTDNLVFDSIAQYSTSCGKKCFPPTGRFAHNKNILRRHLAVI